MLQDIRRGLQQSGAIALGYAPIGFAVAATSCGAGLSPANTWLMALLVYAGSSQLAATQLFLLGAPASSIIVTVFVVNLRHLLMSSSLAGYVERLSLSQLAGFCFQLTDEAFAVHAKNMGQGHRASRAELFTVNAVLHLAWLAGTAAAIGVDTSAATLRHVGLDFAPAAMFIALLALLIEDTRQLGVALMSGALAVALHSAGLGAWSVLVTTVVCASLGTWSQQWISTKSSSPLSA